jgi:hypothetical protein
MALDKMEHVRNIHLQGDCKQKRRCMGCIGRTLRYKYDEKYGNDTFYVFKELTRWRTKQKGRIKYRDLHNLVDLDE